MILHNFYSLLTFSALLKNFTKPNQSTANSNKVSQKKVTLKAIRGSNQLKAFSP